MKKTTAERDPQAAHKLRDLIHDISVAMVTTVTPDGALRSRPLFTQEIREEGELWFFTSDGSGAARDLQEEHAVNICYADPAKDRYVAVSGNANLVRDRERVHELWHDSLARFFPQGPDDPHIALLQVRIETAEYWDQTNRAMVSLHDASHVNNERRVGKSGDHTRIEVRATPASG